MPALKNSFSPIRLPHTRPTSGKDVNRVQDAIEAAMKKLAADMQAALDKKKDA